MRKDRRGLRVPLSITVYNVSANVLRGVGRLAALDRKPQSLDRHRLPKSMTVRALVAFDSLQLVATRLKVLRAATIIQLLAR